MNPAGPTSYSYAIHDSTCTALYYFSPSSGLGIQHFAALQELFQSTDRFDRLHNNLVQMFMNYLRDTSGAWAGETSDLEDVASLFRFLSACHRAPTPSELQQFLRPI